MIGGNIHTKNISKTRTIDIIGSNQASPRGVRRTLTVL